MASTNIQTFPGKVGVSNTNPVHTLDVGSNVYIDDTGANKLTVTGNIHASGITIDGDITVIDTQNLAVKDPIILLASESTGTTDTGIIMKRADGDSNVAVFYDEGTGLKICHTMSGADDTQLVADTSNALNTSIYGAVTIENTTTQALSVGGGAQIDGNFQVGEVANLYVDTTTGNVGIGKTDPAYTMDVNGAVNATSLYVGGSEFTGGFEVAIGTNAGQTSQGTYATAVGYAAGQTSQGIAAIAVGYQAGQSNQGSSAVAMGRDAGKTSQGGYAIAVGPFAGETSQGNVATAVGNLAGQTAQGSAAVAVGNNAGYSNQGGYAIAVGPFAGETSQGNVATAVGNNAGRYNQSSYATALGTNAGRYNQSNYAVAVGFNAGETSQGNFAIAVGRSAGEANQHANSIVLNASGSALNTAQASSFYVKPVRGGNFAASALAYTSAGEVVEETNVHFDASGNVGIGTANPSQKLHVNGDILGGCPVLFSANRSSAISGAQDVIYDQVHYNKGGGYSGTTGKFTAPLSGYYKFNWHDLTQNSASPTYIYPYINNGTVVLPNATDANKYGVYDNSADSVYRNMAGSWIVYLNTGDTFHIRLISGAFYINMNCFNGFYLSS